MTDYKIHYHLCERNRPDSVIRWRTAKGELPKLHFGYISAYAEKDAMVDYPSFETIEEALMFCEMNYDSHPVLKKVGGIRVNKYSLNGYSQRAALKDLPRRLVWLK